MNYSLYLFDFITDVRRQLERYKGNQNPNLDALARLILDHIEKSHSDSEGFRILVFVRTRASCQALSDWMNDKETDGRLRDLNAKPFTGTGAQKDSGGSLHFIVTVSTNYLCVCLSVCVCVCLSRFYGLYLACYESDFDQSW